MVHPGLGKLARVVDGFGRIVDGQRLHGDDLKRRPTGGLTHLSEFGDMACECLGLNPGRDPAVAIFDRPAQGVGGCSPDIDRGANRSGPKQQGLSVGLDHVVLKALPQQGQDAVADRPSTGMIDAQGLELFLHPAGADAEPQAAAGQLLDGRHQLGRLQRQAVGQEQDGRAQADAPGGGGQKAEGSHWIEKTALGKSLRNAVRHIGLGRNGQMFVQPQRIES